MDLRPVYVAGDGDVKGPASSSDGQMVLFSGSTGKQIKSSGTPVTAQGLALLDDNTAAEQRTTLGLGSVATINSTTFGNALLTALSVADQRASLGLGNIALWGGGTQPGYDFVTANSATAQRALLGLGTTALVNYSTDGGNLLVSPSVANQRALLGLGNAATWNGSTAGYNMATATAPVDQRYLLGLGTAATKNVMTTLATWNGSTDILTVGAFGLGSTNATFMPTNPASLNGYTVGGYWRADSKTEVPTSAGQYNMVHVIPGGDITAQQLMNHTGARLWIRSALNGAWNTWREAVTGRPTAWWPLVGFAANWYGGYNLGSNRQGTMVNLIANVVCTSGLFNYQAICVAQHSPGTNINFIGDLLGSNGSSCAVSMALQSNGTLVYNYTLGTPSSPGIPAYPMAINCNASYRTADGGQASD